MMAAFSHLGFNHLGFSSQLTHICQEWLPPFAQNYWLPPHHLHKKTSLIHSDSNWWWQPSWILPCWIQTHGILDSFVIRFKKHSHSNHSFNLTQTQLDDGSHLEFCHPGLHKKNFTYLFWLNLMMAAILNFTILILPSWIQPLSDSN